MADNISIEDIRDDIRSEVYTQDYSQKSSIDGVKILDLKSHASEDGNFSEVLRLSNGEVEDFPGFKISQINKSKLSSNSIKAWHLHLKQDEIWYVSSGHLLLGLWDLRKDSTTSNNQMRIVLGGGANKLVYIPKGVAHGCSNLFSKPSQIIYFVSEKFNIEDPDEKRIKWDALGADFWSAKKE